jgi:WD40 repeat protein
LDLTIRIWDIATAKQIGEPLLGHSDTVLSVSYSPDGKSIASGSFDGTIRLWNPQTGK